ncbi:MAG TPA: GDP-mannose 4,6-dehydratase [Candidatus Hydrogenedentes bacterium]|jgi:dTDP-glucose 4,6-dehydratase|nr:GDP-mannose 4,6-dehydratase [Candidatus Hydrogenedentota bacterium]MDY0030432.1 GDP-mannose 4,6-dehydratase [FCB group bacterium]NLT61622.1 NAD-dependent epimerase/dehydratase family protein [Candidatus Hydrogenedentota bacterium]HNV21977.1 GDP-mannose 4,6-dehydratase [Candidatus Hydrogenedentota bacterium]HNZ19068.1 GDP-mannose 4,6-dehydratase [Candidatus Hydrogenedentota bacterium]
MDWQGRKVLITGAAGFIGSHLCERLLLAGADVRAMVHGNMRGSIGHLAAIPEDLRKGLEIVGGNIRDGAFVRDATIGMDTVFHLAAITSVVYSYSNPDETVITNVSGTLNVCNAARHENVRRLVHTSSAGVYGTTAGDTPISETHPVRAYNPYTASKLAADNVVESFHLSYELPVTIVRIFNVYGPRIGRFLIIPTIILQLLKGSELKLGSLTPTRNFTYVDDIVDAYLLMAEHDSVVGEVVNFGSKRAVTIAELALLIAKLMQREVVISQDDKAIRPAKSEIERVLADVTKANQLLGWRPAVELEDGLKKTIDWIAAGGYDDLPA